MIIICAICVIGVYIMGLRMDAANKDAKRSKDAAAQLQSQINSRTELVKNLGEQANQHYKNYQDAQNEIDRRDNSVAAGTGQLHIDATCPELPAATTTRSVDHVTRARLTRSAEQNYSILRERIALVTAQLAGCQDWARTVSESQRSQIEK